MSRYEEMKKEINKLVQQGVNLYEAINIEQEKGDSKDWGYFAAHYEQWYTKSLRVIKQLAPERLDDFNKLYKNDKRKELDLSTYTIDDALKNLTITKFGKSYGPSSAANSVARQALMVKSTVELLDSKINEIQLVLQADVFDSEIDSARHLLKKGFLRAAGAICGVVLEKHFAGVARNHNVNIKKKAPTIADFNDAFKDVVYDVIEWRKIQHLGDIRNLCDHNKGREPNKEEVEELINGTDRVIKNIF